MNKGNTKRRIARSFMDLVIESPNPRTHVNVTEIVSRLNMDRKTFYHYFDNTTDLVIWIFRSEIAPMISGEKFEGFKLEYPDPSLHDKYQDLPFFAHAPLINGKLDQSSYFKALCDLFNTDFEYYRRVLTYSCYLDFYCYLVNLYKPAIRNDILELSSGKSPLPNEVIEFLTEYHTIAIIGRVPYHFSFKQNQLPKEGLDRVWNYSHEILRYSVDNLFPLNMRRNLPNM